MTWVAGRCAQAISLLVQYMNKTPEVAEFTAGWESRLQFSLDGEEPFGVVFEAGTVKLEKGKILRADVTFYCESGLFFDLMTGRLSQDDAFSNGLVDVKGSIIDSVKFRHAAEITQARHRALFSTLRALSRFT